MAIIGNIEVADDIPFQAYTAFGGPYQARDHSTLDKGYTAVSPEIHKRLIEHSYVTAGIIVDAARHLLGIDAEFYPDNDDFNIDQFVPNPENVVWKVFPDKYKEPRRENR